MKTPALKNVTLAFLVSSLAFVARADTLNNTFDTPFNYVANGIIGETNWDGVYLRFGDIPGGNAGGSGNGNTTVANTASPFPGFLNLQSQGTSWTGAENDGVFLYKVVQGDFDVSVQNVPGTLSGGTGFDNRANNLAGLMMRAYHTNNSGASYSTTLTNNSENNVRLWRFNEFAIDGQIRFATNGFGGAGTELNFPGSNFATNDSRFFRIVRTAETNFTFFVKTNLADAWFQVTNGLPASGILTRRDWAGVALQVGIAQAAFSTATRDAIFDDFQLSGPNVTLPALPVAAPSGVTFSPVNSNSISISWTTNGGNGSLVMVRANGLHIANPVQGTVYAGDTNFQSSSSLLGAANNHVVYIGPATNVTVTGLGGSNNTYNVAVFTYSGSGASTVYNTANPATNSTIGPGRVSAVSFTVSPTNIPANGVSVATVTATYNSGDSYDVSADTSTVWNSSNPAVIFAANGLLTGLTNGTSTITATYAGVTGTNIVSVHQPVFRDEFSSNHDYATNGVGGSVWDGLYLGAGDVPFQIAGNLGPQPGTTMVADANLSSNGLLTVTHRQTGWEGNESDGFFLFKRVPGDFQVAVHIHSHSNLAFHMPGLMARLFTPAGGPAGTTNATFPNGRENHVRWSRFDQFNISTTARRNLNGGNQVSDQVDGDTTAFWLLMVRNSTTFTFYKKVNATDGWSAVPGSARVLADATNGAAMQVGLGASTFDSGVNFRTVRFEHFMLDADNLNLATPAAGPTNLASVANPDGTMTLSWNPAAGSAGTLVIMRPRANVNAQPLNGVTYTANPSFGLGSNLGSSNYVVYAGTGSTVIVTNLLPGTTYYSAAYAYYGSGASITYSLLSPSTSSALALGVVQSVSLTLGGGNVIPNGGIALPRVIAAYSGGLFLDVTPDATITFDPTSAIVATNGVLTALSNGPVTITAIFGNKTNSVLATVRDPLFRDNFNVNRNYLATGVAGSIWQGVYFGSAGSHPANSIPGGNVGVGGDGTTVLCDANVTSNNVLTVQSVGGDWEFAGDDGFFLFRQVPGDFQMSVHLTAFDAIANQNVGIMARAFGSGGAPASTNGESWVSWSRFDQFGIQTDGRSTFDNATTRLENRDGTTNMWLMLVRQNGTNFYFLERANPTDPWLRRSSFNTARADLAGRAVQVGIQTAMFSANTGQAQFDNFMLEAQAPLLQISSAGTTVTLSWVGGGTLQSSLTLGPTASWNPVGGTPTVVDGTNTLTLPIINSTSFFRVAQ